MRELGRRHYENEARTTPDPAGQAGFTSVVSATVTNKRPPLSRIGSRFATLVHQGSDPTQPYPTWVIRDRAPHLRQGFAPLDMLRRCPVPHRDGRSVGSASPDGVDLTRFTPSLPKIAGRISSRMPGPVPRRFWTRANSSASGIASSA